MENKDALKLILERNAFYRRLHFLALFVSILILIVFITLFCLWYFLLRHPNNPYYFATDKVGRLINVVPVTQPNMSTDAVSQWMVNAVEKSFSLNYVNYRSQLQNSQRYFTPYGWSNYMRALNANNNVIAIRERKMIVLAQVVEKPKLITEGLLAGAYAWRFQMPVLVTYWPPPYDEKTKYANALDMSVIVQRQEVLQSEDGLGIVQIIARLITDKTPQEISESSVS